MNYLYFFRGKVKKGAQRGRDLGFPTANISLHKPIPEGIYVAEVTLKGKKYRAVTFIGSAKTFEEKEYKAENYLLDFSSDIYNDWITVAILKKLRGNKKFASAEELVAQMKKDILQAHAFFSR